MDIILLYLVTFVLGYWIFKKFKEYQLLPPGPWGVPVLGYLPFLDRKHPHLTLTKLGKEYGPIYGIKMGSVYTVVLSDTKLIREAFAKDAFAGRAPLYLTHGIMHGNGLICAEGGLWKDQRKLVSLWFKSFGMSKHGVSREKMEKRIAAGAYELLENIDKKSKSPMELPKMLTNSLGNVVNGIIFGYRFPLEDKTWNWFRQIQEEGCHEMGVAGVVNFLPFIRYFSSSTQKTIDILTRGQAQTHRLYASIINKRRKELNLDIPKGAEYPLHANLFNENPKGHIKCITYSKQGTDHAEHYFDPDILIPIEGDCILDNFLQEQKRRFESGDSAACYMTDEQMYYLLADLFGAGLDTTATSMSWFLLYMALYQDEQEKVRKEILTVYPEDTKILEYSLLPQLMAAIYETLRIRSIVPLGIPHGCMQDTFLANYKIPKGAMMIPLQWAVHMDPSVWDDPETFKPSRFLDSDGSLLKTTDFIPFQTGKRMCPGDELARMSSCGLMARLFRSKRVFLASDPPSHEEMQGSVGVTLVPPHVLYRCEAV